MSQFACRAGCGQCCIVPSIASPLPGMPNGKPAGVPCVNLDSSTLLCKIWQTDSYPQFCRSYKASEEFCGSNQTQAKERLIVLQRLTSP